eukprot:g10950.t1
MPMPTVRNATPEPATTSHVARSGKDYANLFFEAIIAAGVKRENIINIVEDAEKNSGIRVTKTMRSRLEELTIPDILTLPESLLRIILSFFTIKELLYFALTCKSMKNATLAAVKSPKFPPLNINCMVDVNHKNLLRFTQSLLWLKPKVSSLKIAVGNRESYIVHILGDVFGNSLETLEVSLNGLTYTKEFYPFSLFQIYTTSIVNGRSYINPGRSISEEERMLNIKNHVWSIFGRYDVAVKDWYFQVGLFNCNLHKTCPKLKTFVTNDFTRICKDNNEIGLPNSLENLRISSRSHGQIERPPSFAGIGKLPNLRTIAVGGYSDELELVSASLEILDVRPCRKGLLVNLNNVQALPNLQTFHIKPFGYAAGLSFFTSMNLYDLPQHVPLKEDVFHFCRTPTIRGRNTYPRIDDRTLLMKNIPKNCTIVAWSREIKVFSYHPVKGLHLFDADENRSKLSSFW